MFYAIYVKRVLDLVFLVVSAPLWIPLMLILIIAVRLTSAGPVFFTQTRVGKGCRHFTIYKFRSMRIDAPKDMPTHLLENPDSFITPVGRFLRRSSLDELPQIINIIKGDITIVGPRPALWNQDDLIEARTKYGVNDITPGLTGWAQINGRDELPIEVKAKYDGEYLQRIGILMDCQCFFMTIFKVFKSEGVKEGKH